MHSLHNPHFKLYFLPTSLPPFSSMPLASTSSSRFHSFPLRHSTFKMRSASNSQPQASSVALGKPRRSSIRKDRLSFLPAFVAGFLVCYLYFSYGNFLSEVVSTQNTDASQNTVRVAPATVAVAAPAANPVFENPARSPTISQSSTQKLSVSSISTASHPVRYCENTSQNDGPCIFDIGHNSGQDTRNYLKNHLKSRVIAIEANPTLVQKSNKKFASYIASKRLILIGIGLTALNPNKNEKRPKLKFYVNRNDKFSSFTEKLGCRNYKGNSMPAGDHSFCNVMELETKNCADLVNEYGTPIYMKIDIEGLDRACLQSLASLSIAQRPKYTSIENVALPDINILLSLGYTKFKVVNQNRLQEGTTDEEEGHSGPWGENAVDQLSGKNWQTAAELKKRIPLPNRMIVDGIQRTIWYDMHASK